MADEQIAQQDYDMAGVIRRELARQEVCFWGKGAVIRIDDRVDVIALAKAINASRKEAT